MDLTGNNAGGHNVSKVESNVDFDELLERVGGDAEFLQELFDIFLEDSVNLLSEIKENIASGDNEALQRTAHKLKGSISNFVPTGPVFDAAKSLEFMGRENELDAADTGYQQLTEHLTDLHSTIKQYGDNLA
ncbi:MAG: hypothetical protein DWQ05_06810 [Calditrichaeota bacterium]|nr:MAG: hypothetical protein DWQ05_06810 [Calditrichota bacterium]